MASGLNASKHRRSYEHVSNRGTGSAGLKSTSDQQPGFLWTVYSVFLLLGIAMLWPWNGLMAASPYFQLRFASSKSILRNFQAAELSVSTVANLGSVLVLAKLQANASYPKRIVASLLINMTMFALLAISARVFLGVTANAYVVFLMLMVFTTSLGTGFMQNGCFAHVESYKRPEYMQGIMLGQGVAGVLPPIAQIASVLGAKEISPTADGPASSTSAFVYFLTATGVSLTALLAFLYLMSAHDGATKATDANTSLLQHQEDDDEPLSDTTLSCPTENRPSVPLSYLARRLFFSAAAVFITFAVTMVFPVFTQKITTTNPDPPRFLQDASFIPLGLLLWNSGDLLGRLLPLISWVSLARRPRVLFVMSIARFGFIPLYLMCNVQSEGQNPVSGTWVFPDAVYLLLVQLPFGISNGYLGSCCMMGFGSFVSEAEAEPAGAFMGLMLVAGLAFGSFCSFFVGNG